MPLPSTVVAARQRAGAVRHRRCASNSQQGLKRGTLVIDDNVGDGVIAVCRRAVLRSQTS